jgi:anion-transporting  ArsA/GET3 family ATPase
VSAPSIAELVRTKRVIVLCGPGGVGKTTTSASIGLAAAQAGRRVLVLTIDPARRLADALGLPLASPVPRAVPADRLRTLGLDLGGAEGSFEAWMLDPKVVFERVVRVLGTPAQADKIVATRLFAHMSELAAGMLEYTAGEALYSFVESGKYDLVVLDTPPSRNALDFLDAPTRLSGFLEDGILKVFAPGESSGFLASAGRMVTSVFGRVFGESFMSDLETFFGAFGGLFGGMRKHSDGVAALLASNATSFLLVTSPDEDAHREAEFFRGELARRKLPFAGFVLNRSLARLTSWSHPAELEADSPTMRSALDKLAQIASKERGLAYEHASLLAELREVAGATAIAVASPMLLDPSDPLAGLVTLAKSLGES